ncbi:alpha-methylacyl-CoA racemase [Metarhizium album ARSEF 1941]|uniref:Alpha-methylacyl-CoA racemase n=1 Tax=Metarhizium album (strain ARSEF 1941) TaxID=1081103 RepID=A0A0B2WQI5_METAS|nr:alpha-methylacyl-CoA racemase [Metarhizium album ARSEF 1941]KHN95737.1 alpha-methylacyl-CoA racemase [Metarhizium album ARSEF 1941]
MAEIGPPPLAGITVLEFAGLAPGPFAGMLLADAGASVIRVDRASPGRSLPAPDALTRRKASVAVDLKSPRGTSFVKELVSRGADVLIDPFRPGVLERLGLGPSVLLGINPRLVYARLTGFRRDGRYAAMAGHDINYLAVSGALSLLGRAADTPLPPTNMLADFAGGGATLFQGILLALLARHASGRGQVVEANMVDGSAYLATFPRLGLTSGLGARGRGRNLLDGGCPFYDTYETRDGRHYAVGALEPHFFRQLLDGMGLRGRGLEDRQLDVDEWPAMRALFERTFRQKTRAEWEAVFDGTDACAAPVLDYHELERDPAREGDQRPAVTLRGTPCLAIKQRPPGGHSDPVVHGRGAGVPGDGYHGEPLAPGDGGERALESWLGWKKGREYDVRDGAYVLTVSTKESSKL